MSAEPWRFFGGLLAPQRNGSVRPLELSAPCGQVYFTFRCNAHLVTTLAADRVRLYYKEARVCKVCAPGALWHHYRYYPEDRWLSVMHAAQNFHCRTSKGGRWLICEGSW